MACKSAPVPSNSVVLHAGLLPCLQDIKGVPKTEMLYTLTGMTGSLMYMAPEVPLCLQPNGCIMSPSKNKQTTDVLHKKDFAQCEKSAAPNEAGILLAQYACEVLTSWL